MDRVRVRKLNFEDEEFGNSCRYCPVGVGIYRVESEEGIYYLCEEHFKELVKQQEIEKENF